MSASSALTPAVRQSPAEPYGRTGFAFGRRAFLLAAIGLVWLGPAFLNPRFALGILAWDVLLLLAAVADLYRLPRPEQLIVTRRWSGPVALSVGSSVEVLLRNGGRVTLLADVFDEVPAELRNQIPQVELTAPAGGEGAAQYDITPSARGDTPVGYVYIHYQSPLRLAERWARAPLQQTVRVYPNLREVREQSLHLARSRQIEMQQRQARARGVGREFESLREYRQGDDFRNICWSASARRGKLVSKLYQSERSQTVWLVIDCGRLMQARIRGLARLDYAVNTALCLAEVALYSGDRVGLLAYDRAPAQRVLPRRGSAHLRHLMETLVDLRAGTLEADHLRAVSALMNSQKRRSLVIWLTDLAETAMTPEVIDAALQLTPQHLVLFTVIGQPDLLTMAAQDPINPARMYEASAAQEIIQRRQLLLARMRDRGALLVEVDTAAMSAAVVNAYLDIRQQNRL
ncbi:MAG TPA: DUF58 domain-containing protein [Candidatus Binatia bacterium]|nr:DUF58 domain-containing protein [Candidatus Binatia bacterium]